MVNIVKHYKRFWEESTGEKLTDSWGTSTYYFQTDEKMNIVRQIQVFEKGQILKYSNEFPEDKYSMLSDQPLDEEEFEDFKISSEEFNNVWNSIEKRTK